MLNQEQINGKWEEIKGGVRNLWGNITDEELETTNKDLHSVSSIVEKKYRESKESITEKLESLMKSFDNETDKSMQLNDGISSYQRNPTEVRTSQKSQIEDTKEDIRTRSPERTKFDHSIGGAINTKQGIAGNKDNVKFDNETEEADEYEGEEIFDNAEKEDQTYEARTPRH